MVLLTRDSTSISNSFVNPLSKTNGSLMLVLFDRLMSEILDAIIVDAPEQVAL